MQIFPVAASPYFPGCTRMTDEWGVQICDAHRAPLPDFRSAGATGTPARLRRRDSVHASHEYACSLACYTHGPNVYLPWLYLVAVPEPDKSRAVFVHARDDCPPVRLPECVRLPFITFLYYDRHYISPLLISYFHHCRACYIRPPPLLRHACHHAAARRFKFKRIRLC